MLNNYKAKLPADRPASTDKARSLWGARPYTLGTYIMSAVHDPDHEAIWWDHMSALEGADRMTEWYTDYLRADAG